MIKNISNAKITIKDAKTNNILWETTAELKNDGWEEAIVNNEECARRKIMFLKGEKDIKSTTTAPELSNKQPKQLTPKDIMLQNEDNISDTTICVTATKRHNGEIVISKGYAKEYFEFVKEYYNEDLSIDGDIMLNYMLFEEI